MTNTIVIPWDHRWTFRCPSCGGLGTEWHPDTYRANSGWGRCHAPGCGASWKMSRKGTR